MENPERNKRWLVPFIAGLAVVLNLASGQTKAGTVAYWRFEPGELGADSSGEGHNLAITGITSSTDKATNAPGTGSAVFDGSSFAQTMSTLGLTNYTGLTLEWFMKTDQQDLGIIYEHSPNYPVHELEAYAVSASAPSLQGIISPGNIVLSWPATAAGFALQTTDELPAAVWSPVTATPVVVGGLNQVTVPIRGSAAFYRLNK